MRKKKTKKKSKNNLSLQLNYVFKLFPSNKSLIQSIIAQMVSGWIKIKIKSKSVFDKFEWYNLARYQCVNAIKTVCTSVCQCVCYAWKLDVCIGNGRRQNGVLIIGVLFLGNGAYVHLAVYDICFVNLKILKLQSTPKSQII